MRLEDGELGGHGSGVLCMGAPARALDPFIWLVPIPSAGKGLGGRDGDLRAWSVAISGREKSEEEGIHLGGGCLSGSGRASDCGEITVEGIAGIVSREMQRWIGEAIATRGVGRLH